MRGDQGAYWEDGAASSAAETAINRAAARKLRVAEWLLTGLHASGRLAEVPVAQIRRAWETVLLYDEHTWGAAWSISEPHDPRTIGQFAAKAGYAHEAARLVDLLLQLAATEIPAARRPVRAMGGEETDVHIAANVISTPQLRVTMDPATGLITSIVRRADGWEIVECSPPDRVEDGFGQVLYYAKDRADPPNNRDDLQFDMSLSRPRFVELRAERDRLVSVFAHDVLGHVELHVAPATNTTRLDLEYRILGKHAVTRLEAVYFAFPFAFDCPTIDYEVGGALVRAGRDWIGSACLDWFSVQDFVVLRDTREQHAVIWSSYDAPLICLQDVNTHRGLTELPIENGRVYSYVMNNFWQTNFKAAQGGDLTFRYAIQLADAVGNAQAAQLASRVSPAVQAALDASVRIAQNNARVVAFKLAEDGDGYIVRVQEMDGRHGDVTLILGALEGRGVGSAEIVRGIEQPRSGNGTRPLPVTNGTRATTHLHPYEIQTVRVRPSVPQ